MHGISIMVGRPLKRLSGKPFVKRRNSDYVKRTVFAVLYINALLNKNEIRINVTKRKITIGKREGTFYDGDKYAKMGNGGK